MTGYAQDHRVVVVGGTGFIGSHLVDRLEHAGHPVLVLSRRSSAAERAHAATTQFATVDIRLPEPVADLLAEFRPKTVFHLAASPDGKETPAHMRECVAVNTIGTMNVFEAAVSAGASLFVFADSSKTYGNGEVPYRSYHPLDPACSYAVAKAAAWQMVRIAAMERGIATCGIRPTIVYGPRQRFCLVQHVYECYLRGEAVKLQGGEQTRDLLYVKDAVEALYRVMDSPKAWGHAIPIGGGHELSIGEWCRAILGHFGSNLEVIEDAEKPRPTEIWRSFCDNAEARELLGWQPVHSLGQGLTELYGSPANNAQTQSLAASAGS